MDTPSEMLKVQVDFNQSRLLFPSLIRWLLLFLLGLIAIAQCPQQLAKARAARAKGLPAMRKSVDWKRLGGCLALTVVYFMGHGAAGQAAAQHRHRFPAQLDSLRRCAVVAVRA